jgi:hypothetical protein
LNGFCKFFGIDEPPLINALVEFQCSSFVRNDNYELLREYAARADKYRLPKLGWIHGALVKEPDYQRFVAWFRQAKGWTA